MCSFAEGDRGSEGIENGCCARVCVRVADRGWKSGLLSFARFRQVRIVASMRVASTRTEVDGLNFIVLWRSTHCVLSAIVTGGPISKGDDAAFFTTDWFEHHSMRD